MTPPNESGLADLDRGLARLAANSRMSAASRRRIVELRSAVRAQRVASNASVLSETDLDRLELLISRLHIMVGAKKQDLRLQLKQYDQREKRLAELLGAIDNERAKREKPTPVKVARSAPAARRKARKPAGGPS